MKVSFDKIVIDFYKLRRNMRKWLHAICYSSWFYIAIAVLLFFLMRACGISITLDSVSMFTIAIGLITYINVIITFWNSKSNSDKNSSNYYLGRNIETYRIHENTWIQLLNNSPLKLFLVIVSIIPAFIMLAEVFTDSHIFVNYSQNKLIGWFDSKAIWFVNIIDKNAEDIRRIWLSVFIFIAFIGATALIEIVILYRISFIKNRIKPQNTLTKLSIEIDLKNEAYKSTDNLFSLLALFNYTSDPSRYLNQIDITIRNHFEEGVRVCGGVDEYHRFLDLSFSGEESAIEELLEKVTKQQKNEVIIQKLIEMIHYYFWQKWNTIHGTPNIPLLIVVKLAKRDLYFLAKLETILSSNDHYTLFFWGDYQAIDSYVAINDNSTCNKNIAQIVDVLAQKFSDTNLKLNKELESVCCFDTSIENNVQSMFVLLDKLNELNSTNGQNICVLHSKKALEYVLEPLLERAKNLDEESPVRKRICRELKFRAENSTFNNALSQLQDKTQ